MINIDTYPLLKMWDGETTNQLFFKDSLDTPVLITCICLNIFYSLLNNVVQLDQFQYDIIHIIKGIRKQV
jgi:hypothetical protein